MEVSNTRRRIDKTEFNKEISKQFVPYWNGLLHLVANVEDGVIVRRYDWNNVIHDCEKFEQEYLNTENFCESCLFYNIPSDVEEIVTKANLQGIYDCKQIAQDNDIVYTYCIQRKKKSRTNILVVALIVSLIVLGGVFVYFRFYKRVAPVVLAPAPLATVPIVKPTTTPVPKLLTTTTTTIRPTPVVTTSLPVVSIPRVAPPLPATGTVPR